MKTLLLLFISFTSFCQTVEIYQEGEYVKKEESLNFEVDKNRVLLQTETRYLELLIIRKESKSKWICSNSNGDKYTVTAKSIDSYVMVTFEPEISALSKYVLYIEEK